MRATWLEQEPGIRNGCPCGRMVRLIQAPSVVAEGGDAVPGVPLPGRPVNI
jgi:hypothetical protein